MALPKGMSEAELAVLRKTEPSALATLDEDALLDLHGRVRRARNKYVGQYRRQARARVDEAGARGAARSRNQRARDRAEVFEAALARVSTALAKQARQSAAQLKAERIAAARADRAQLQTAAKPATKRMSSVSDRPPAKSAGRLKKDASSRAKGARRQAKRDAR